MASSLAGSRNQAPARNHWQQTCTGCRAIHQHCGGRSHSGGPCARCARRGIRCVFPEPPAVLPSRNCPTNELYAGSSSGVARNWIQPSVVTIPSGVAPSPPTGAHCLPQAHGAGHSLEPPNGAGGLWQSTSFGAGRGELI
ncbi:uncharacterized protein EI90DRAFT_3043755 [Cantharellus anzutake]|uniref:uncharacterized protein n=1 Tax=Cantharellus anzutake TaxID=1750568 RepID=UPI0019045EAA|nr:uncharacterized protein EI90DRAFT_3043755 [Cantharellus anzutake]KAF8336823.1 hypothetical protein EI90DRAFT_3043755 [Cantharellus anzutake]